MNSSPPSAIIQHKQMVRGVERWYVDFNKCIPYFADDSGLPQFSRNAASEQAYGQHDRHLKKEQGHALFRPIVFRACLLC